MRTNLEVIQITTSGNTICSSTWHIDETYIPFHRLYYVKSGSVRYQSAMEEFTLQSGTLYLFPIYTAYKMSHDPSDPMTCLYIHMTLNHTLQGPTLAYPLNKSGPPRDLMRILSELIRRNAPQSILIHVLNTLIWFMRQEVPFNSVPDKRMEAVIQYVQQNYNHSVDNSFLADIARLDRRYFIRLFRKYYGQTPQAYVASYRAFKAGDLLLKGNSVKATARLVGFTDSKAFSRFFKAQKGCPPSVFQDGHARQP